jgi:hypothetical protein
MRDITDPRLMYVKAGLLAAAGLLACGLIVAEMPSLRVAALLGVAVWAWCRVYYFCFYVIEKYIDPKFRFAGLGSVVRYWLGGRR